MPDTPSITINHQMTYRGKPEIWSNTYHFSGTTPTTDAAWDALGLAIWGTYKNCVQGHVKYAGHLGYEAGNEHAVSIKDYVGDGTLMPAGQASNAAGVLPGDASVWVRWRLPTRNSRGKWNYLRKYLHGVAATSDTIETTVAGQLAVYAGKMTDGTLPGGFKICGDQGEVAGASRVAPNVGFRQLKRTGKRPSR